MSAIPEGKLDQLVERWQSIQAQLAMSPPQAILVALSKEFSELDPVAGTILSLRKARNEVSELEALAKDPSAAGEMAELAEAERTLLQERIAEFEHRLLIQLLPKDAADEKSAILEVRAGTGGDEAALFAADLFRMYARYADLKGWKIEIISLSENDLGGYKEAVASITGKGVFARLKFESGVHRVQRIPATETSGRIHTSAATVAVLPEVEELDFELKESELRIDRMRAGGAGGQHVNKTESAIRITHVPTGIMVVSAEKSQHQNLRLAMQVMRSRLYEIERQRTADERAQARKEQVGSGDRSQRIRTYNFPQGRVTDHRINLTLHKLASVIEGSALDELIDALTADHQAGLLAAMGGGRS